MFSTGVFHTPNNQNVLNKFEPTAIQSDLSTVSDAILEDRQKCVESHQDIFSIFVSLIEG